MTAPDPVAPVAMTVEQTATADIQKMIKEEKDDWRAECLAFGVDPNCYGAGFHDGLIEGLERARAALAAARGAQVVA